jgi:hypothetical protein
MARRLIGIWLVLRSDDEIPFTREEITAPSCLEQSDAESNIATNNNRVLFTENLTAEPELNYPPKGTAVVNASLANR